MKRFVSVFLLCVILPFMFLCPLSSNAAIDIQGTEYPTPSFLPIDVDFSEYDYYFVYVSGKPESPNYKLYLFKDTNNSGHLYFSATLSPSSSVFHSGEFTSFGVTSNYEIFRSSYSLTSGTWSNLLSTFSTSDLQNFIFDGYTEFSSSYKYIIGCNADIYDYSGNLVRRGDYDNLVGYFRGGLNGSSDKSESTGDSGSSGGSFSVDLSVITDSLKTVSDWLSTISDSIKSLKNVSVSSELTDILGEIKAGVNNVSFVISENFTQFTETFSQKIATIQSDLFDFKKIFIEFASANGEIKKLTGLFSEIHISISNLRQGLENVIETITTDFNYFADDVKANVSSIRMIVNDFTEKFNTIISKLDTFSSNFNKYVEEVAVDIRENVYDIKSFVNNCVSKLVAVISNLDSIISFLNSIKNIIDSGFAAINDNLSKILSTVNSLPDIFSELLEYLFIPKEDHFTKLIDEINEHFGFVHQIIELGDVLVNAKFDTSEPSYTLNVDSDTYGHFNADIADFSLVEPHVSFVKSLISGIVACLSIRRWRKRLPDIINGTGGD